MDPPSEHASSIDEPPAATSHSDLNFPPGEPTSELINETHSTSTSTSTSISSTPIPFMATSKESTGSAAGISGEWVDGENQDYQVNTMESGAFSDWNAPDAQSDILAFASRAFTTAGASIAAGSSATTSAQHYEKSSSMSAFSQPVPLSPDPNRPLAGNMYYAEQGVRGGGAFSSTSGGNIPIHCTRVATGGQQQASSGSYQHMGSALVSTTTKEVDCCRYELNKDAAPQVIVKTPDKPVVYQQDVGIRYLKPPTPPPSGEIVIREVRPPPVPEAPPLYVRLRPERPKTPPPLVIREAPPAPPKPLPTVYLDKVLPPAPPPPRKVIVERLPPLPPKPQQVIIEKWLPYEKIKRNIVYQRAADLPPPKQVHNTLITWEPIKARIFKRFHNLGIIKADPAAYASQHCHQMSDTQSTMNAIASVGAQLHYNQAAYANMSGQSVYYDDKQELNRLMRTNFHPNDPICKQFVNKFGSSVAYSAVNPCAPAGSAQNICQEAQEMARAYSTMTQMHREGMHASAVSGYESCQSDTNWLGSAYGPVAAPQMVSMQCEEEVMGMYPQFCQGSQFVPIYPHQPSPMDVCPFSLNEDHCIETCGMCQQLMMTPQPSGYPLAP